MSGKCRPSLRPKTLYNVDRSSLSTTDKECIHSVFELADHQKSEIEKNEKIIKAANDLIETQKAEIERFEKIETAVNDLWNEIQKLATFKNKRNPTLEELLEYIENLKDEAVKEFLERLKPKAVYHENGQGWEGNIYYDFVVEKTYEEMVGDAE